MIKCKNKNIARFLVWILVLSFFADSANLDNFIPNHYAFHSDSPVEEYGVDNEIENASYNHAEHPSQFLTTYQKSTSHSSYDQDSPSLAAGEFCGNDDVSFISIEEIKEYSSISIYNDIYLLNCSLLI